MKARPGGGRSASSGVKGKIALALASPVLFLVAVELSLRLAAYPSAAAENFGDLVRNLDNDLRHPFLMEDRNLFWKIRPQVSVTVKMAEKEVRIVTNSEGMRDAPFNVERTPGSLRILCLGDSIPFGYGVSVENTYVQVLERLLSARLPDRRVEVLNAGCTGYTSFQGLVYLKTRGLDRYRPDLVTFHFGINDGHQRYYLDDRSLYERIGTFTGLKGLFMRLNSYRLLRKKLVELSAPKDEKKPIARVSPEDYKRNISEAAEFCRSRDVPMALIRPTSRRDEEKSWRLGPIYGKALFEAAKENGLLLLNVWELSERAPFDNKWLFCPDDAVHPNEMGHNLLGEKLEQLVLKVGREKGLPGLPIAD